MQMTDPGEFAIVVGEHKDGLRRVEIRVGNERLTGEDRFVYPPAFLHAMRSTANHLRGELNFLRHERELWGFGIEEAFERVSSGDLHEPLRVLSWGPTTDDCVCFLLPVQGKLWLAWKRAEAKSPRAVPVLPYDLIRTIEAAILELETRPVS